MALGDVGRVRRLAGNPALSNVTDADIQTALSSGTSQAIGITGKSDWETDITNAMYDAVVVAVEYFASSYIRDRFMDQIDTSTEHFNRATAILTSIVTALSASGMGGPGSGTAGNDIAIAVYKTSPLNPSAPPYRSLTQPGSLIGVERYAQLPQ